jgi:predicted phosphodiesterase
MIYQHSTNRILFAGDPHGNFQPLITAVQIHKPQAVVLLGDYELTQPLDIQLKEIINLTDIWWIAGNHDFQTPRYYHNLFHSRLARNHLHLNVVTIAGLRIVGLSGIFLGRVWYPPQEPKWLNRKDYLAHQMNNNLLDNVLPLKYQSAIWYDEIEALKKLKADILVTHEAPRSHIHGFHVISELAGALGVKHVFHGHLHENYASIIKRNIRVCGVANETVVNLAGQCLCTANSY